MPVYIDIREVKEEAKSLMQTANVSPFRLTLLFLAINTVLNLVSTAVSYKMGATFDITAISPPALFAWVLVSLLSMVLLAGYTSYCLEISSGHEMTCGALFSALPYAGKVILLSMILSVLIGVGVVLLLVPGIYFAFAYAFALFHLCLEPEAGVFNAMRRSRLELRGYKWQFFTLLVSFLPLLLLFGAIVALCEYFLSSLFPETLTGELLHTLIYNLLTGCAALYMSPYITLSQIAFFRRVTAAWGPGEENRGEPGGEDAESF